MNDAFKKGARGHRRLAVIDPQAGTQGFRLHPVPSLENAPPPATQDDMVPRSQRTRPQSEQSSQLTGPPPMQEGASSNDTSPPAHRQRRQGGMKNKTRLKDAPKISRPATVKVASCHDPHPFNVMSSSGKRPTRQGCSDSSPSIK